MKRKNRRKGLSVPPKAKPEPIDERVIHLTEPNTLSQVFPKDEWNRVVSLKITGPMGRKDFDDVLDEICTVDDRIYLDPKDEYGDYVPDYSNAALIRHLDLGEAIYVDGKEMPYFGDMAPLRSFVLPQGIQSTFEEFEGSTGLSCSTNLRSIAFPKGLKKVGGLSCCPNLTDVVLPDTVEEISPAAFYGCTAIDHIQIPASVRKIGGNSFGKCSVEAFDVDGRNEYFTVVDGVLFSKDLGTLVAFPPAYSRDRYTVPHGTVRIGDSAFNGVGIREILLPESLRSIGYYAFEGCMVKSLDLPDSVRELGNYTFVYCTELEHLRLPRTIETLPDKMVVDCYKLKEITIPASVRRIGEYAFRWCPSIKRFVVHDDPNDPDDTRVLDRKSYFKWEKNQNSIYKHNN